jgi:hypothetical protein
LFPKLKEDLWGRSFSSDEEVKAAISQLFWEKEKHFLKTKFKNLLNDGTGVLKVRRLCGQVIMCSCI